MTLFCIFLKTLCNRQISETDYTVLSANLGEIVMKPDVKQAMQELIIEVRQVFPFTLPEAQICAGKCVGCPKKLLEIADTELSDWEAKLENGEIPCITELNRLGKLCKNIHRGLERNNLILH